MILLVVLLGLYAIGAVGYYKLSMKLGRADEVLSEYIEHYPKVFKGLMLFMSLGWPLATYWQYVKEAAK